MHKFSDFFVGESEIHGKGIFAKKDLKIGEIVHLMKPFEFSKVTFAEVEKWPKEKRQEFLHFAFQGGPDFYFGKKNCDDSFFMNHSCDPNCWFSTDYKIVTRKKIKKDEELTIDYATLMAPNSFDDPFDCVCRSKYCRGRVTRSDCNLPYLKKLYKGHFLSFIELSWAENKKIKTITSDFTRLTALRQFL